jgi:hypothetical protein
MDCVDVAVNFEEPPTEVFFIKKSLIAMLEWVLLY